MSKRNFLLGNKGENLIENISLPPHGGPKKAPYTFSEAQTRLGKMLDTVVTGLDALPDMACPNDYAIATITLHPGYIAKTAFPAELLRSAGLEAVGSRPRRIMPEKHTGKKDNKERLTTEIFVKGTRKQFATLNQQFQELDPSTNAGKQLSGIEVISFPTAATKLKNIPEQGNSIPYEVVLHMNKKQAEGGDLEMFRTYLSTLGIQTTFPHRFYADGLCFLGIEAPVSAAERIATFSLLRVMRAMPSLRLTKPHMRTAYNQQEPKVILPQLPPVNSEISVAIFDGGIPPTHPLTKWVTPYEFPGMLPPTSEMLNHGVFVSSAFLFGHIDSSQPLPVPYAKVDHYRVIDDAQEHPFELFEVLKRIKSVLDNENKKYDFINLSLGPALPVSDDEVHAWTASLDQYLSDGQTLATIAVGNYYPGQSPRVQVPADCVNALAIGACDRPGDGWKRAPYSAMGPGRSPGLIKPDLVDFGGGDKYKFLCLDPDGTSVVMKLISLTGTSCASPAVLRLATGIRAHFGKTLNLLAIRALMVHSSDNGNLPATEVGWGRVARNLEEIAFCKDSSVRVVYYGAIAPGKDIRISIPFPSGKLKGDVIIKATLCYATLVDSDHPGNYTRSGLTPVFRPHKDKFSETGTQPKSRAFFSKTQKNKRHATEEELRTDAWKWENCIHGMDKFRSATLKDPFFDIHYNARAEGHKDSTTEKIRYAMIITLEAPEIIDLYEQVLRKYATRLEAIKPSIDIPLLTTN